MKTITIRQMASIKRSAQNVNPLVSQKQKIAAKISELGTEYKSLSAQIEGWDKAIIEMTGYTSEQLVTKVVTPILNEDGSAKLSPNGQPVKQTRYEINTDLVKFNEEKKVYEVTEPEDNNPEETLTATELAEIETDTPNNDEDNW